MVRINLSKLQKYIENNSHRYFPARELWMKDNGSFWAYEECENCLYTTNGYYENNRILFRTTVQCGENVERELVRILDEKIQDGYQCFAVRI